MEKGQIHTVGKEQLKDMIGMHDILVVNVLEEDAYRHSHIKGSVSISLEKLIHGEYRKLDKSKKIVTYCASYQCTASRQAAQFLKEKGFDSYAYEGGMKEWKESGLPVEGENQ
jgi:rhodanese-related sulfurtransferase